MSRKFSKYSLYLFIFIVQNIIKNIYTFLEGNIKIMGTIVNLYSEQKGEISKFLRNFYNENVVLKNDLKWEKDYENPIEMADIVGIFVDNKDMYNINMWISLDEDAFINVTENNVDKLIRYLYERYPY